jgi:BirA family biotin operon repressor/biotin-[acetyl-CoA-carboxylase] ligase
VTETVTGLVPGQPVGLHWPNDVFAAGRKLAGILVEVLPDGQHVLGIGLNTNNTIQDAPPELRDTAVTLRDLTGAPHDPTQLLLDLLRRLDHRLAEVGAAPDRIGQRANALCLQRGQQLLIESGGRQVAGLCVGIATDGALVLDTPAGRQLFHSGVLANSL